MMHGRAIWKPGGLNPQLVKPYSHKTQSFMKNGGQQKCFDEGLIFPYEEGGNFLVGSYPSAYYVLKMKLIMTQKYILDLLQFQPQATQQKWVVEIYMVFKRCKNIIQY